MYSMDPRWDGFPIDLEWSAKVSKAEASSVARLFGEQRIAELDSDKAAPETRKELVNTVTAVIAGMGSDQEGNRYGEVLIEEDGMLRNIFFRQNAPFPFGREGEINVSMLHTSSEFLKPFNKQELPAGMYKVDEGLVINPNTGSVRAKRTYDRTNWFGVRTVVSAEKPVTERELRYAIVTIQEGVSRSFRASIPTTLPGF